MKYTHTHTHTHTQDLINQKLKDFKERQKAKQMCSTITCWPIT